MKPSQSQLARITAIRSLYWLPTSVSLFRTKYDVMLNCRKDWTPENIERKIRNKVGAEEMTVIMAKNFQFCQYVNNDS